MSRSGTRTSRRVTVLTAALLGVAVGAGTIAGCANNDEPELQALETGDTESFMKYATEDCEGCRDMAATIDDTFAKGGELRTEHVGPVLDSKRNLLRQRSDTSAPVILHYYEGKATITPEPGADPEEQPIRRTDQRATMTR